MLHSRLHRAFLVAAGLYGAAGVATAAIAAHAAAGTATGELLRTASQFLMIQGAAIAAAAALGAGWAGGIMTAGTLLFCGDLLVRAWTGQRILPLAAPVGGSLLIIGWLALAWSGLRRPGSGPG
ncbi:hypothetical protein STVA_36290 [Allostella vacuolata]|nr:hypothetical protein STVA_36290 [Stella vacuolata]